MTTLLLNIGNTNITYGFTNKNNQIKQVFKLFISELDDFKKHMKDQAFNQVVLCSVVPSLTNHIKNLIKEVSNANIQVVTHKSFSFSSNYASNQAGLDRLCVILASIKQYHLPLIVIDLGTATTFNVINKESTFTGGYIHVGLQTGIDALILKTAQLPHVKLTHIEKPIGTNTEENLVLGALAGHAAMIDGMIDKINRHYQTNHTVVITGGHAQKIKKHLNKEVILDEHLLLKGLLYTYEK